MNQAKHPPCVHCGSPEAAYVFHVGARSVQRCKGCKLISLWPLLRGEGLCASADPGKWLLEARKKLGPQGRLKLNLFDAAGEPARGAGSNWDGYRNVNYALDRLSLQNLLAKAGFEGVRIRAGVGRLDLEARVGTLPKQPLLSVIVPVYNEAKTFPILIKALLAKQIPGLKKEIIIIESGSSDGTRPLVQALEKKPGVRVIYEERPQGKGHAVRQGLKAAKGDWILIQDGDLEYDIDDYDDLMVPLMAYQTAFVLGSRHSGDWKMRKFTDQPGTATILNTGHLFFTFLLNVVCGSKLRDPFTMFKVFRRDCLNGLDFKAKRFDFDFELMIKLLRKGYQPLEIPVNYRSRSFNEGKKVRILYDPMTWFWALIRFRLSPLYKR